ncbi:glutaredoxin domain-containing protein [Desulfoferula mesophila]|uniref:Glutaredoxin domain-containing protein n=1 Tax=Desulfoferula mesophila TaxID=3058419 RepID=A0AAU9EW20_9BACT|nr:hypothetical protein FAK_17420 [Desulfoferula mesophilus]
MAVTIYTATGCARCKIAKKYMAQKGVEYRDLDIKAEGKDEFNRFYRENRKSVYRGPDGIEFPVYFDGQVVKQGLGVVVGHVSSPKVAGFFGVGLLHGEWVDGIHISQGDPEAIDELVEALAYLKSAGMKFEMDTDGRNPQVLERLLAEGLGDVLIVRLIGTKDMYAAQGYDLAEVEKTMALAAKFPEYRFALAVRPVVRPDGAVEYLKPEEAGEIAAWVKEATGGNKHPFVLTPFDLKAAADERFAGLAPLEAKDLFIYRSKARAHQVMAAIA